MHAKRGIVVARPLGALLLALLFLAGCAGRFPADSFARTNGFTPHLSHGRNYDLKWFLRGAGPVLHVYIEGDGKALLTRRKPSPDPTPHRAESFRLAARDQSPAVAYLARPCQFTEGDERRGCAPCAWTSARFSEQTVSDMSAAVDEAMRAAGATRLVLVGYSGGGAVAMLLAARRDDVALAVTVAGNLNHAFWTEHHGVSPLRESLNPADFADRLQSVPQIHVVSDEDHVIPPIVAQSFVDRMGDQSRARILIVHGLEHDGDWGPAVAEALKGAP